MQKLVIYYYVTYLYLDPLSIISSLLPINILDMELFAF